MAKQQKPGRMRQDGEVSSASPLTGGDEGWLLELHVSQGLLVVEHAGVEDAGSSPVALL